MELEYTIDVQKHACYSLIKQFGNYQEMLEGRLRSLVSLHVISFAPLALLSLQCSFFFCEYEGVEFVDSVCQSVSVGNLSIQNSFSFPKYTISLCPERNTTSSCFLYLALLPSSFPASRTLMTLW